MKTKIWMTALAALILIAGLLGLGYLVYQAGVAQGSAGLDPSMIVGPTLGTRPLLTTVLGFLLFLFLIKFVGRLIFFPVYGHWFHHRGWGGWMAGPGRRHRPWGYDQTPPPYFQRWHDLAHGEQPADEEQSASEE